jgi:ketosteroid isomerase-like protein
MGGNMADVEKEIQLVIERIVEALNTADAETLRSLLADRADSMHIGSDPKEWWTSGQLVDGVKEAMEAGGSQIRAEVTETSVHSMGDVAWSEGRGRFINGDGQKRDIRLTAVFVREGGAWRGVQSHASIGVDNADIFRS